MNLVTVSLIVGTISSGFVIFAYLYKGISRSISFNTARNKAQQGRITAVVDILEIQSERITALEDNAKKNGFVPTAGLKKLEQKAFEDYNSHHTNLT